MAAHLGTLIRAADVTEKRLAFYQKIGLDLLQIAGIDEKYLDPGAAAEKKSDELFDLFRKYGFSVPSLFLSFPYQDWSRSRETVGVSPEAFRAERMVLACRQMLWSRKYGIRYIACHVGSIPEWNTAPYRKFLNDLRQMIYFAEANGQQFLFETGMESVSCMKQIISELAPADPGINFDPANLLIYDQTAPDEFLSAFMDKVRIVHCKDAVRPRAGEVLGKETPLGKGDTRFADLLSKLLQSGFSGPLIIERELVPGAEQEQDIAEAAEYIKNIYQGVEK